MSNAEKALAELRRGHIIIVYDGDEREGEADLIFHASFASPAKIELLRKDAGGLICAAIGLGYAKKLELPFFTDLLDESDKKICHISCRKTAYGDKPAFSLPINHCEVYTGITDNDRSLTLRKLEEVLSKRIGDFENEFYSPGHVFLLIGRGIENRKGHTELSLELAKRSGLSEVMVLCEMLGSGKALSKENVKLYAKNNGLVFIEGKDVIG
ncbi:3,4-dihydroxy-2-butanone-4-phosphate synthase [Candidatus Micrarchaeota archaeon]|nr:3,4-dihydroxy-2-butanone-4-phosphate synthase [Candidatus Micrarchaeota archaeon]